RERKARPAEIDGHRWRREPELREAAEVLGHEVVHPHLTVLANDPDLVDLRGTWSDLGRDVPPRKIEHLAPGRYGAGHISARALHRADDPRPRDHLVEDLDEVGIAS